MTRRLAAALLAASLLSACPEQDVPPGGDAASPGLDAAAAPGLDAAPQPPDAAFRCVGPDAGGLTTLASLCADLVAGEARLVHGNTLKCPGEPLEVADMPHLASAMIEGCQGGTRRESDLLRLEAAIAAGRVAYDPAKQAACKALRAGDDAGLPILDGGGVVEPCRSILVGKVAQGAACEFSEECAPGLFCRLATNGSCGGTCTPLVAEGQPCQPSLVGCVEGTFCFADSDGGVPTCQRLPALGESCTAWCASGTCLGGTCVAVPDPKEGEPCNAGHCAEGFGCAGETDAGSGTCRPLAQEGEACNGANPPCAECLSCSKTSGGTCRKRAAVGDPCSVDGGVPWFDGLVHLWCQPSGTWALKPRTGETCTAASGCLYQDDFCRYGSESAAEGACARKPGPCETCGRRFDLSEDCLLGRCFYTEADLGVCAMPAGEGEGCDWATRRCSDDLVCVSGQCQRPPSAVGAACGEFNVCGPGLYCPANDAGAPVCAARKPGGEPCAYDFECLTDSCTDDGVCTAGPCPEKAIAAGCWMGSAFEYLGYLVFFAAVLGRRRRR